MSPIDHLLNYIRVSYGVCAELGFSLHQATKELERITSTGATTRENTLYFGKDDPNDDNASYQYCQKISELMINFEKEGRNARFLRNAILVNLYAVWEHTFRPEISRVHGVDKKRLQRPAFGDLRRVRQAILHVNGRLDHELELLTHLSRGDVVVFTEETFFLFLKLLYSSVVDLADELGLSIGCPREFNLGLNRQP